MPTQIKLRPTIAMDAVTSAIIDAIGHCAETNTLAIQFPRKKRTPDIAGKIYHYANVTAEDFAAFKKAESIGTHFGKYIKPEIEKYPFINVS